ncbi:L,D-transpeptidase [Aquincola sp. S2]|uniref:L,D-transpeptidase n=1 Tax=Pseudaquabacterium terrae TaxID=2732868 RepID=A0ABX2ETR1_9BURK|nr:L,D-transpeptidase [Aquabacterium terrae]NRF72135.1 L,D-transpeptidase [Aquabacterium terrae]
MALAWAACCGAAEQRQADFGGQPASAEARAVAQWAYAERNAEGRPFAVVDKKNARIHVFGPDGRLVGASAALLGLARGDDSVPGIGARPVSLIAPQERTTPAGRFESVPGRNDKGEAVVWVDYETAIAIHRVRPGPAAERRAQRLDSDTPADNRISLGCIVVSEGFFEHVVAKTLGRGRGVVYVLPETRDWQAEFGLRSPLQL